MEKENQYNETQKLLLGLELIYPNLEIIPKIRFICESLTLDSSNEPRILNDLFNCIKVINDFEITSSLEKLVFSEDPKTVLLTLLKIQEIVHKKDIYSSIRFCLECFDTDESLEKINPTILNYLESDNKIGNDLKEIYLEDELLEKIKKILELYNKIYSYPLLIYLKDFYKHYIIESSTQKLWFFLYKATGLNIINRIKRIQQLELAPRLGDSFSKGQIKSKLWALNEIKKIPYKERRNILILCSWYGVLSRLLFDSLDEETHINTVDIDPSTFVASKKLNYPEVDNGHFVAYEKDINDLNYDNFYLHNMEKVNLIINTSCEHLNDFKYWFDKIENSSLLLLQSNNYFDCEEHSNCVSNIDDFKLQAPMRKILFQGQLKLEKYTRFMLIGYK